MMISRNQLWQICRFVRLMSVEPFLLFYMVAYTVQTFPQDQLIQDKICVQRYGQPLDYCLGLPKMSAENDTVGLKSSILADSTAITMYIRLLVAIPSIITCLFVGHFIDQCRKAKKLLLLVSASVITIETTLLFLNSLFFSLDVSYIVAIKVCHGFINWPVATIWAYVSSVTPNHLRGVRMSAVMISMNGASPIGLLLGGFHLNQPPRFVGYEIRNYSTVYFISIGTSLLAFLAALLLVDEFRDRELYRKYFPITSRLEPLIVKEDELNNNSHNGSIRKDQNFESGIVSAWQILLNLENVGQILSVFCRPRSGHIRLHIYLSILAISMFEFCSWGVDMFGYQYVERVFNWNTSEYSLYQSLSSTINIVTSILVSPIILKVFGLSDLSMSILALSMVTIQNLLRAVSTDLSLFNLSAVFFSLNLLTSVGFRAYISTIVERSEHGSIFGMMSIFETVTVVCSTVVLSNIFRLTIDTMPTLAFMTMTFVGTCGLACGLVIRYQNIDRNKRYSLIVDSEKITTTNSLHK